MKSQTYTLSNYKNIPQISSLSCEQLEAIEVVGSVFPFETNDLIVNELINWDDVNNDPVFKITFPQKYMLSEEHYKSMKIILDHNGSNDIIDRMAAIIRHELYPNAEEKLISKALEIIACDQQKRFRFLKMFKRSFSDN